MKINTCLNSMLKYATEPIRPSSMMFLGRNDSDIHADEVFIIRDTKRFKNTAFRLTKSWIFSKESNEYTCKYYMGYGEIDEMGYMPIDEIALLVDTNEQLEEEIIHEFKYLAGCAFPEEVIEL